MHSRPLFQVRQPKSWPSTGKARMPSDSPYHCLSMRLEHACILARTRQLCVVRPWAGIILHARSHSALSWEEESTQASLSIHDTLYARHSPSKSFFTCVTTSVHLHHATHGSRRVRPLQSPMFPTHLPSPTEQEPCPLPPLSLPLLYACEEETLKACAITTCGTRQTN